MLLYDVNLQVTDTSTETKVYNWARGHARSSGGLNLPNKKLFNGVCSAASHFAHGFLKSFDTFGHSCWQADPAFGSSPEPIYCHPNLPDERCGFISNGGTLKLACKWCHCWMEERKSEAPAGESSEFPGRAWIAKGFWGLQSEVLLAGTDEFSSPAFDALAWVRIFLAGVTLNSDQFWIQEWTDCRSILALSDTWSP